MLRVRIPKGLLAKSPQARQGARPILALMVVPRLFPKTKDLMVGSMQRKRPFPLLMMAFHAIVLVTCIKT